MFKSLSVGAIGVKADLATAAGMAARHGFDAVHLNIREVAALGAEQTARILARAGVQAAGFGLPIQYRQPDAEFDAALTELRDLAVVAQALGVTRTTTWVPSWHDTLDFAANHAFLRGRFGRIADILADHGIRLGLEFLGPKTLRDGHPYEFIHTMDGMLAFCDEIGVGNLGLLLDAYHWYTAGGTLADLDRLTDAAIVDVHVNDAPAGVPLDKQLDGVRGLPGETGVIGIPAFLRALDRIGYTGPVMVEPFSQRVRELPAEDAVRVTGAALNHVWREAGIRSHTANP
jgi:sugar phosphate isomerase/epimerase